MIWILVIVALYGFYEIIIGLWMMFVGLLIIVFSPFMSTKVDEKNNKKTIVWSQND